MIRENQEKLVFSIVFLELLVITIWKLIAGTSIVGTIGIVLGGVAIIYFSGVLEGLFELAKITGNYSFLHLVFITWYCGWTAISPGSSFYISLGVPLGVILFLMFFSRFYYHLKGKRSMTN